MDIPNYRHTLTATLKAEYPQFESARLEILEHFQNPDGRIYNAFLLQSNLPGLERFVAKGDVYVGGPERLRHEWEVLRQFEGEGQVAPRLLFPAHRPENYLLLQYLEGSVASQLMLEAAQRPAVMEAVGKALAQLHSRVTHPLSVKKPWRAALEDRLFQEKLPACAVLLPDEVIGKARAYAEKYLPYLQQDAAEPLVYVHRDAYLDNYIVDPTGSATLIDYGLATLGRPLFDFAKLCVIDLARYPTSVTDFLHGYTSIRSLDVDRGGIFRFYLLYETLATLDFLNWAGQHDAKQQVANFLLELLEERGAADHLVKAVDQWS